MRCERRAGIDKSETVLPRDRRDHRVEVVGGLVEQDTLGTERANRTAPALGEEARVAHHDDDAFRARWRIWL